MEPYNLPSDLVDILTKMGYKPRTLDAAIDDLKDAKEIINDAIQEGWATSEPKVIAEELLSQIEKNRSLIGKQRKRRKKQGFISIQLRPIQRLE